MKELTKFLFEIGMLGRLKRTGPLLSGVENPETVAEHCHRATIIAYILAKIEKVDVEKVLVMSLFHDVPESRIGDINKVASRYIDVKSAESKAIEEQAESLHARSCSISRSYDDPVDESSFIIEAIELSGPR